MGQIDVIIKKTQTNQIRTQLKDNFLKGDKGDSNILTIGTVEKGEEASASITGESPNQTLNLVLPKGDVGEKGDTGEKGDAPQRGVDYWTAEDVNEMQSYIATQIQTELGTLNDELEARLVGGE